MGVKFTEVVGFKDFDKCEDCIHKDVCADRAEIFIKAFATKLPVSHFCEHFKRVSETKIK